MFFHSLKVANFILQFAINFKKLGGEFVTLGTDSHVAKHDWAAIDNAREIIKKAGFKELATFSKMKVK
ncbi:hypothetical protein LLUC029_06080 [Lactococcus cremoris]|uniref:Histidinol-phosphatase n=1 Tax=Lactococcus lactis subsp. cremoris TaxID=1359 RepID=A0AAF0P2R1_LACLC|nr:hypothetical protein [Lactococcus cremoris]WMF94395.1 hypothetical protein LLJM1_03470 [Lactococcus cremoris]